MNKTKSTNIKEFRKLLKVQTDESYKTYLKAQKNYVSVLKKFIKKQIASGSSYQLRHKQATVLCLDDQFVPYWAFFEDLNNEIKVLDEIIWGYECELLNPEEFEEDA